MLDNQNNSNQSNTNNKDNNLKMKTRTYARVSKILGFKYFVLTFFWLIFFGLLLTVVILFTMERLRVNSAHHINDTLLQIANSNDASERTKLYQELLKIKYPIIDFSLLTFLVFTSSWNSKPISGDYSAAWNQRVTNINVAYSYVFITALVALIALIFYFVIIVKLYLRAAFERKYNLQPKFHNGYDLFNSRIYLRFIRSLAIVLCFFNFLSTLIAITYGIILLLASGIFWYAFKEKTVILLHRKWWKSPNFILYFSIALIQNGYNILKTLFANQFGVDLDLILTILFPVGTITIILAILIRNLLNANITQVKKAIKNINTRINSFRIFFYSQKEKSLEDFTFVEELPVLIRTPLKQNLISAQEAYALMIKINESSLFIEKNFEKESEKNYMLYHLFNEITDIAEIDDIKTNVLKVQAVKKPTSDVSF